MKLRYLLLLVMVGYNFSLVLLKFLNKIHLHPLVIEFPIFGIISTSLFWTVYFGIEVFLVITLLGSGTTIKNKTEVHIHEEKNKDEEENK